MRVGGRAAKGRVREWVRVPPWVICKSGWEGHDGSYVRVGRRPTMGLM